MIFLIVTEIRASGKVKPGALDLRVRRSVLQCSV